MHQSVATISSPEFINLQPLDINPLMSKCEIKVLYLGENRNHSYISKEVATEMSKTLRGAPIVGWFREDAQDFGDHGRQVIIEGGEIKFNCLTKPYGFVSPDAEVWFQKFEDYDDFGNKVEREYLMTTGYLWTGQFEECKCAVEGEGRPHSMELDEDSLDGRWSKNLKTDIEFFIINDAIFSKLCILGEDVEPCFEGSSVKTPDVSASFTKIDDNFKYSLFTMMQELTTVLKGGQSMEETTKVTTPETEEPVMVEPVTEFSENSEDNVEKTVVEENQNSIEDPVQPEFAAKEDKEEEPEEENKEEDKDDKEEDKEEEDEDKKKYSLLVEEHAALQSAYSTLQADFSALQEQLQTLIDFKNQIEDAKKDELINSFYMLSDEDKADVVANKANYSLDDIESKLSVICVRKKVNFSAEETEEENKNVITNFNLSSVEESVPAWVSALRNTQNSRA